MSAVLRLTLVSSGAAFAIIAELETFSYTATYLNWQFCGEPSVTAPDQSKAFRYSLRSVFQYQF